MIPSTTVKPVKTCLPIVWCFMFHSPCALWPAHSRVGRSVGRPGGAPVAPDIPVGGPGCRCRPAGDLSAAGSGNLKKSCTAATENI